jgi:hypothetical protein
MNGAFLSAHSMDDQRNQTTVIFACPQCNLAHEVTQTRSRTKKAGGFDCADCGAAVHSWYGFFDYSDWGAINMTSMTLASAILPPDKARSSAPPTNISK